MLQSGKKNCLVQCNYCDKQLWKLFTFFVLIKLLCFNCNIFYSCLSTLIIEYVIIRTYPSKIEYVRYVSSSLGHELDESLTQDHSKLNR